MKTGLLLCDDTISEMREQHGTYTDMFSAGLRRADPEFHIQPYEAHLGELPESTDECDCWLISGSRHGVYEDLGWIQAGMDFVRQADADNKKTVGICFGHQLVAQAMGGEVKKSNAGWGIGVKTSQVHQQPEWMAALPESIRLLYLHQDQVTKLPPNTVNIAGSDFCPNSIIQIGDNILGVQGHPEFSRQFVRERILARKNIIPQQTSDIALENLDQPIHAEAIFDNIVRFLRA